MPEYTLLKKPQDPPIKAEAPVLHKECGTPLTSEDDGSWSCDTCLKSGFLAV